MSKPVPYLLQGKNIILVIDGQSHTVSKDTHMNYGKIVDALKAKDWDVLADLVEPKKAIVNFGKGYVTIDNGVVYWKGTVFNNALAGRMIEMYQDGFPIDPMIAFMENLMANPSKRSVEQVYGFLEKNSLPITEDGHFLAYKKVRKDMKDIHSGTIDNSIGQVIEMDRNLVDDNPDSHCSTGLHFCSISYLGGFGSHDDPIMILKINPADVVSIPTDYNGAKGRCMKYEVVAQVNGDPADAFASVVDKTHGKVVKKTVAAVKAVPAAKALTPQSAWPFPVTGMAAATAAVPQKVWPPVAATPAPKSVNGSVGQYDVKRKSTGDTIASGISLHEARTMVAKAVAQKKAVLQVVDSNGIVIK
jgi:hypothetical protein